MTQATQQRERVTLHCTLHLEVRSRDWRTHKPTTEQRVYTCDLPARVGPRMTEVHMRFEYTSSGYTSVSTTIFYAKSYDPDTHEATYQESFRASDKIVDRLENFGWVRRRDLEGRA